MSAIMCLVYDANGVSNQMIVSCVLFRPHVDSKPITGSMVVLATVRTVSGGGGAACGLGGGVVLKKKYVPIQHLAEHHHHYHHRQNISPILFSTLKPAVSPPTHYHHHHYSNPIVHLQYRCRRACSTLFIKYHLLLNARPNHAPNANSFYTLSNAHWP